MAHTSHAPAPPEVERYNIKDAGMLPTALLGAGVVGIGLSLLGLIIGFFNQAVREQFAHSWLFAFTYFFTLCAGSLFWVLIHHATDAEWSVIVRRQLENTASLLWIFFWLFLPLILFCAPLLWHWWNMLPGEDPSLDKKAGYLNHGFFWIRYILYFVVLCGLTAILRNNSVAQDTDGQGRHTVIMRKMSAAGLILFAVSLTFAAVDWLMGLQFHWFSTMWGVYIFAGTAASGMALLVIVVTALRGQGYLKPVTMEHYHIMGKWMLAFTIFWAYIGFDQYMLTWYANIPEETSYYLVRNTESWVYFSTFLVVARFFVPFAILLTQWIKKEPRNLCWVAGLMLFMQMIDIYVVVLPALHQTGFVFSSLLLDIPAFVGIGGLVGWLWFRKLPQAALFPTRDPRLAACLKLTN